MDGLDHGVLLQQASHIHPDPIIIYTIHPVFRSAEAFSISSAAGMASSIFVFWSIQVHYTAQQ